MQYRCFNGEQGELKKRIQAEEQRHYLTSLELTIAEGLGDDAKIVPLKEKVAEIERTLTVLHSKFGK